MSSTTSTTSAPPQFTINRAPFRGPVVSALIDEMVKEMNATYGEPTSEVYAKNPLDVPLDSDPSAPEEDPTVSFLLATAHPTGTAAGCVALKFNPVSSEFEQLETAELKRLYVQPSYRAAGLGQKLLDAAEAEARSHGVQLLLLETGVRQVPSIKLYERNGWRRRELFGVYKGSGVEDGLGGFSVCYEKRLV